MKASTASRALHLSPGTCPHWTPWAATQVLHALFNGHHIGIDIKLAPLSNNWTDTMAQACHPTDCISLALQVWPIEHCSPERALALKFMCLVADVLGAWASAGDEDSESDSGDSSSSEFASEADISAAMQDGLSLAERYPVQSAQDVRGTWTPLNASGLTPAGPSQAGCRPIASPEGHQGHPVEDLIQSQEVHWRCILERHRASRGSYCSLSQAFGKCYGVE